MPVCLPRLSASILTGGGRGAICAFFLCSSAAWAQSIPQGYVATREGDVIVMRPSAAADPDITIRVYPPVADDDAGAAARRWAQSHPVAGVDPSALLVKSLTLSGVSTLDRFWKDGAHVRQELILMPQAGTGRYQPVVARMPTEPELIKKHSQAAGLVVSQIVTGKFQPNMPAAGKGNAAVNAAHVEPTAKRTAPKGPAPSPAATRADSQPTAEQLGRLAAEIETVGFITRTQMGVGGMFLYIPKPVALFRSGDALLDIGNLSRVTSVEADRAAHPRDWGRWKRSADGIELSEGDKWKKLDYPRTMERLPAGFGLSGNYDYLSGGGDTAILGGTMIVSNRHYAFWPDGKYSSDRLGFVSSIDEVGSTVVRSQSPAVVGRYSVDGYLLRLEPPAGPPETHVLVYDPKDPNSIWIDGHGYTRDHQKMQTKRSPSTH